MDFNKFKIQIADGSTQYRGLSLAEIIEMGFRNYYLYITKYHKRKLTKKEALQEFNNYKQLAEEWHSSEIK